MLANLQDNILNTLRTIIEDLSITLLLLITQVVTTIVHLHIYNLGVLRTISTVWKEKKIILLKIDYWIRDNDNNKKWESVFNNIRACIAFLFMFFYKDMYCISF